MKKHSIALFLPDLSGGGAERVCLNLANEFASRGLPVRNVEDFEVVGGIPARRLGVRGYRGEKIAGDGSPDPQRNEVNRD